MRACGWASARLLVRALWALLAPDGDPGRGQYQVGSFNEIPTVPTYYLANPQAGERACTQQRGKKTLLSLTLV